MPRYLLDTSCHTSYWMHYSKIEKRKIKKEQGALLIHFMEGSYAMDSSCISSGSTPLSFAILFNRLTSCSAWAHAICGGLFALEKNQEGSLLSHLNLLVFGHSLGPAFCQGFQFRPVCGLNGLSLPIDFVHAATALISLAFQSVSQENIHPNHGSILPGWDHSRLFLTIPLLVVILPFIHTKFVHQFKVDHSAHTQQSSANMNGYLLSVVLSPVLTCPSRIQWPLWLRQWPFPIAMHWHCLQVPTVIDCSTHETKKTTKRV